MRTPRALHTEGLEAWTCTAHRNKTGAQSQDTSIDLIRSNRRSDQAIGSACSAQRSSPSLCPERSFEAPHNAARLTILSLKMERSMSRMGRMPPADSLSAIMRVMNT